MAVAQQSTALRFSSSPAMSPDAPTKKDLLGRNEEFHLCDPHPMDVRRGDHAYSSAH